MEGEKHSLVHKYYPTSAVSPLPKAKESSEHSQGQNRRDWNGDLSHAGLMKKKKKDKTKQKKHSSSKALFTQKPKNLCLFWHTAMFWRWTKKRHEQLNESSKSLCLIQHTIICCKHPQVASALRTICCCSWKPAGNIFAHKVTMHTQSKSTVVSKEHRSIILLTQFWICLGRREEAFTLVAVARALYTLSSASWTKKYGNAVSQNSSQHECS